MSFYNTGGTFGKEPKEEHLLLTMATQNKCSSLYLLNYIGKHKRFDLRCRKVYSSICNTTCVLSSESFSLRPYSWLTLSRNKKKIQKPSNGSSQEIVLL